MGRRRRLLVRADEQDSGRGARGAVLVEAVIVTPLLLLLVFGIVEFGLLFKDAQTIAYATRAGARTASSQPKQDTYADSAAAAVSSAVGALDGDEPRELWIYRATSDGAPASCAGDCLRYVWDGDQFAYQSGSWPAASQQVTPCDTDVDEVGVYVQADHDFITGLFGNTRTLTDHTVMRLEPVKSIDC